MLIFLTLTLGCPGIRTRLALETFLSSNKETVVPLFSNEPEPFLGTRGDFYPSFWSGAFEAFVERQKGGRYYGTAGNQLLGFEIQFARVDSYLCQVRCTVEYIKIFLPRVDSALTLAAKPAYRHLSPGDFDLAYRLAKRMTRTDSAKEYFEYDRRFWDVIFEGPPLPIRWEVFRQLDDRMAR